MSQAQFVHLPAGGWLQGLPLTFAPEYDDSTLTYDITLSVRHDNSYRYRNLSLVVDIITADSVVTRKPVEMVLADAYGNWTSGGFGALYQCQVPLAHAIAPDQASSLVVWQAMAGCDTLRGLTDIGIFVKPRR